MKIFKKLLYIIPLFALLSCTERLEENLTNDGKISTTITVEIPQLLYAESHTRAMDEKEDLEKLYLAVFDQNGYLMDYVKAELQETEGQTAEVHSYKVSLTPTEKTTIIHFIGNGPESVNFGSEVQVISSLYKTGNNTAYWQRVVLDDGIRSDGTFNMPRVELIRNFAWIELSVDLIEGAEPFRIDSYCVMNTYDRGSIAPYNTKEGKGWITNYEDKTYEALTSSTVENPELYNGFIPVEAKLNNDIPKASSSPLPSIHFVYEREKSISDNPPYILVKGYYNNSKTASYYRIDLTDSNGNYFPIIRNFKYCVKIKEVKHAGYETPALASTSPGSGDVSIDPRYQSFTNISNGVVRLYVDYTNITLVEQQDALILKYKFVYPNGTSLDTYNPKVTVDKDASVGDAGDAIAGNPSITKPSEDGNWGEITIATTAPGERLKTQDVIVKGAVTIGGVLYELQRRVTINVRQRPVMELECNPAAIARVQGSPFDLLIKIPRDLGSSMFPLKFQIEAEQQSITPDQGDDLPVVTGRSMILNSDGSQRDKIAIGFIKEVSHSYYTELKESTNETLVSIPCHFKSNKAESATKIYVQNEYFARASGSSGNYPHAELGNYDQKYFTNLSFNPVFLPTEEEELVRFSFTMRTGADAPEYILVTLNNLVPAENSGLSKYDNNKPVYKYVPTATEKTSGNVTLNLLTVNATSNSATVTLSADRFADASAILIPKIIYIGAYNIGLGTKPSSYVNSSTNFNIYPSSSSNTALGTFQTTWNAGSNTSPIELEFTDANQLQTIINNNWTIYIKFTSNRTTYVATANLKDLLDGKTVTLTWTN